MFMPLRDKKGMTLVEVLVGLSISTLLFGSMMLSALAVRNLSVLNKHSIQALNVARGAVETIKGQGYGAAVAQTWTQAYDAGPDALFNTADDLTGTVTVAVGDFLDMDDDGNTAETTIDVNDDGTNDTARPIRVTFTRQEFIRNQYRTFSIWIDSLIVA
jgi:type II secretory pathway pseudopilin PulG